MTCSDLMKREAVSKDIVSHSVEFGLRMIGMWPGVSYAHLRRLFYIFGMALFQTFQYFYVITHFGEEDISLSMDVLSATMTYSAVFIKLIILAVKARLIDKIILQMSDDWRKRDLSKDYTMTRMAQISKRFSNLIILSNTMSVVFYATGTMMKHKSYNQTLDRELLLKMELPFKVESSSVHTAVLLTQFVHQTSAAAVMGVIDSLLLTLVLHVCGQIDIVRQRLSEITQKDIDEGASTDIMKGLIVRHQNIISFSQNIEAAYSSIALIQFVSNTMVICCLGFLLVISFDMPNGSTILVKSLLFYIAMSMETFIYCFAGEYLSTKSRLIGDAVYESLWYHLKPSQNQDVLFMIVRSQKQLKLTVGKFVDLSLTQFGNVVKASASYVSVLHAMY